MEASKRAGKSAAGRDGPVVMLAIALAIIHMAAAARQRNVRGCSGHF
jgi:hypothetical protein